jgi:uncharacterized protein YqcC (DUF446 family)
MKARSKKSARAEAKLDAIEAELKRINRWHANPPDLQANVRAGKILPLAGAPTFELWLQCIFLPNARHAAATGNWPGGSQVGLMANRHYGFPEPPQGESTLCQLLDEFDGIATSDD